MSASLEPRPAAFAAPSADRPERAARFAGVRLASGLRLHYVEQGDPSHPVLLLLHGFPDSWFSFSPVLDALAATHRVIALDLPGHGDSDRPADAYRLPDVAADVVAFVEALGVERLSVIGHSFGSLIAQQVAVRAPARVARLVLVGSAAVPGNEVLAELRAAVREMHDVPVEFVRDFQHSTVHRPVDATFMERVVEISAGVPHPVWLSVMEALFADDASVPLARIVAPTLLLWGDRDGVFDRAQQEALLRGIAGASLRVYEGTGHAPHWEEPERFVRDVVAFVRAG